MQPMYLGIIYLMLMQSACSAIKVDNDLAKDMLVKYNYMGAGNPDPKMKGDEAFADAVMNFQNFAGIDETGVVDEATMTKLVSRRCGVPDITGSDSMMRRRRKRYALAGSRWVGTILYNYKTMKNAGMLDSETIKSEVKRAIDEWGKHTSLKFQEIDTTGDIEISFESGDHGDGYTLDGPGMSLAHAFFPSRNARGGDMHFDEQETWTVGSDKGVDLFYVALHELGHSLGLQHSSVQEAVMAPFYPENVADLSLKADDIKGIQALYGIPQRSAERPTIEPIPTTPFEPANETVKAYFCHNGTIDAIGTLSGRIFAFQGSLYAELNEIGIKEGFPRNITKDWPGMPNNLDSVLSLEDFGLLLAFKGDQYWRYFMGQDGRPKLAEGYPSAIHTDFIGDLPKHVDAAYTWGKNGKVYIIQGSEYYRLRDNIRVTERVKAKGDRWNGQYPKNFQANWHVNGTISDALTYDGRTFFFTSTHYIRYNDVNFKADDGYPKQINESWFGCQDPTKPEIPTLELGLIQTESQLQNIQASSAELASDLGVATLMLGLFLACSNI